MLLHGGVAKKPGDAEEYLPAHGTASHSRHQFSEEQSRLDGKKWFIPILLCHHSAGHDLFGDTVKSIDVDSHWCGWGFHTLKGRVRENEISLEMWIIPYWSIVVLLTILAASLLLRFRNNDREKYG